MLNQAFDALKTYDWGVDPQVLRPIDEAIVATHGDSRAREELEKRLIDVLNGDAPRAAKDFVCRQLKIIGSGGAVATLAAMLDDKDGAHMARYALESIPGNEASQALRSALPELKGELKVGVISSLGVRRDNGAVASLAALLGEPDANLATASAHALGDIRTLDAAKALGHAKPNANAVPAAQDAALACAETLLSNGDKATALSIYKRLSTNGPPKHVRLAATRGILACAGASGS